jgi:hypothetical protein
MNNNAVGARDSFLRSPSGASGVPLHIGRITFRTAPCSDATFEVTNMFVLKHREWAAALVGGLLANWARQGWDLEHQRRPGIDPSMAH